MFDSTTHNKLKFANSYIKTLFDNWMSIIDSQAHIYLTNSTSIKNQHA